MADRRIVDWLAKQVRTLWIRLEKLENSNGRALRQEKGAPMKKVQLSLETVIPKTSEKPLVVDLVATPLQPTAPAWEPLRSDRPLREFVPLCRQQAPVFWSEEDFKTEESVGEEDKTENIAQRQQQVPVHADVEAVEEQPERSTEVHPLPRLRLWQPCVTSTYMLDDSQLQSEAASAIQQFLRSKNKIELEAKERDQALLAGTWCAWQGYVAEEVEERKTAMAALMDAGKVNNFLQMARTAASHPSVRETLELIMEAVEQNYDEKVKSATERFRERRARVVQADEQITSLRMEASQNLEKARTRQSATLMQECEAIALRQIHWQEEVGNLSKELGVCMRRLQTLQEMRKSMRVLDLATMLGLQERWDATGT